MKTLANGDYKAADDCSVWIDVAGFTVLIAVNDDGIAAEIFDAAQINCDPLGARPINQAVAYHHDVRADWEAMANEK